jgi:hypothetical protein
MEFDRALFGSMGRRSAFVVGILAGVPLGIVIMIALTFGNID